MPTIDGTAEVKIKPGTQPGDKLRMRGYGVKMDVVGQRGRRGDQYVTVAVRIPRSLTAEQRRLLEEYRSAGKGGASRKSSGTSSGSTHSSAGSSDSKHAGASTSSSGGDSSTSSSSDPGSSESKDSKGQADGSGGESKASSGTEEGGRKEGEKEQKKKRRPFSGWFS